MIKTNERTKGVIALLFTTLLWSTGGLFIKLLPNLSALSINGLRNIIAALTVLIILRRKPKFTKSTILGGICLAVVSTFFVYANKLTTSANAIVMQDTAPIFVLIFSIIFYKRKPKLSQIVVMLITFLGIILVFSDQLSTTGMIGNIFALIAGIGFAGVYIINSMDDASPMDASFIGMIISFIIAIPSIFSIQNFEIVNVFPLLGLGVFQIGLAYSIFSYGIVRCESLTASIIGIFEAILNPIWVMIFVGEIPGIIGIIGFFIVILGVSLNIYIGKKTVE